MVDVLKSTRKLRQVVFPFAIVDVANIPFRSRYQGIQWRVNDLACAHGHAGLGREHDISRIPVDVTETRPVVDPTTVSH